MPKGEWEALISSANPHNASIPSSNYAVSVKGNLAEYIYDVLRSDVKKSIDLGSADYVLWNDNASRAYKRNFLKETMSDVDRDSLNRGDENSTVRVKFLSEGQIEKAGISILENVKSRDRVRIQMFYLSDYDMINAILKASTVTIQPVELLLDPNKDAFNRVKDGTPNRQVAVFLMNRLSAEDMEKLEKYFPQYVVDGKLVDVNIRVRWYNTTGEQNHAKIMSVTNELMGKYVLFNGSANWTGKNLNDINMESNLLVEGSMGITNQFNSTFDNLMSNADGVIYSLDYDHEVYSQHASLKKWLNGENRGFVSW